MTVTTADARGLGGRGVRAVRDHLMPSEALDALEVPRTRETTTLLGFAAPWNAVPIRLLRAEPTRVALVGGAYMASVLAFRVLAAGALIHIVTPRPRAWRRLDGPAFAHRVSVTPMGTRPLFRPTMEWPMLVINDTGPEPPEPRPMGAPWQATLTLLPQLTSAGTAALEYADLVLLHHCSMEEATLACQTLGLDSKHAQWLGTGPEDGLAMVEGGSVTYLFLGLTGDEAQLFGRPIRSDR